MKFAPLPILALLGGPLLVLAQQRTPTPADGAKKAQQVLEAAKNRANSSSETIQNLKKEMQANEGSISSKDRQALEEILNNPAGKTLDSKDLSAKLDEVAKTADPKVREILAKAQGNAKTAPEAVPKPKAVPTTKSFDSVTPPPPKQVTNPGVKEKKGAVDALVIDSDSAYMDHGKRIALFRKDVKLRSKNMDAECQEMEILLKENFDLSGDNTAEKKPAAADPAAKPADPGAGEQPTSNIEMVWMRGAGRMVTIQQRSKSGDAICKGREAVYNAITEKMVITGNAEVEHQGRRQTGNVITITRKNGDFIMEVQQSGKTAIPELKGR